MKKYELRVQVCGHWGDREESKTVVAKCVKEAEEMLEDFADCVGENCRFDERNWGAYEEVESCDLVEIA